MSDVIGALLIVVVVQATAIVALLVYLARRGQAYRALRESEDRFRLVADRAPVILRGHEPVLFGDQRVGSVTSVHESGEPRPDHVECRSTKVMGSRAARPGKE